MAKKYLTTADRLEKTFLEMAERGKDLEKLFRIFRTLESHLPDYYTDKVWEIFGKYVNRNTAKSADLGMMQLKEKFRKAEERLKDETG